VVNEIKYDLVFKVTENLLHMLHVSVLIEMCFSAEVILLLIDKNAIQLIFVQVFNVIFLTFLWPSNDKVQKAIKET
jgi:hypothetical protein